ncbi:excinuclease ABC subunit UvrC [Gammaproteobacteria bacterium]|nr:excinuclease ABC subunit UvrC [Gammaproteobacteria bacterium]
MMLDLKQVPQTPGIYKFFSENKIIYIGKAKNLKKRVSSYFGKALKDRKTAQIRVLTDRIETFSTSTEAEALLLEQSLIKENLPRFNILLRDDKTYPYIHFSMRHDFPSISLKRSKHSVSKEFFGPYISAYAVKSTIKDIQKIYQIRNCSDSTFRNRSRPCIEHQMQRCSAPCVNQIGKIDYLSDISSAQNYLSAAGKKTKNLMLSQMNKFAANLDFEKAQEVKQRINSLDLLQQEQTFNTNLSSIDFFSCLSRHGRTGACILSVRDGKIRGTKTHYFKDNLTDEMDELFQGLIFSYYQNIFSLPDKIFLTSKPKHLGLIEEAMYLKFNKSIKIVTAIPRSAKQLAKLSIFNAKQIIENRLSQSDKYEHALKNLAKHLGITKLNITIEGFDISHHSGKFAVASAVKFSKLGPEKKSYKLFNIPEALSGNDVGSIAHTLERRMKRSKEQPLPDIILIDGGQAQLNAALKVFHCCDLASPLILSIAKGANRVRATETIMSKGGIVEMPKNSSGFMLLQQVRDESHRFAIANNRKKKNKSIKYSILDGVSGLGPRKKKKLLDHFKSLKAIKSASVEELCMTDGISIKLAEEIKSFIHSK